jgi:phosphomannomutase
MPSSLSLIAFDLDDTLAPSKTPINAQMASLLSELLLRVDVCIISGGNFAQFSSQVVANLPPMSNEQLSRLHLMPTCGTQYYRYGVGWDQVYAENLTEDEKSRAMEAVEKSARHLGYWESQTWGPILEDRGSQVTFSALGQAAPVDVKLAWDGDGRKKSALREAVQVLLPDLEVRSGGSTSVDITRRGIDKAYGMSQLSKITGIPYQSMLFIGDRLDPDGNDFPVVALGIPTHAVSGWEDTANFLVAWLGK